MARLAQASLPNGWPLGLDLCGQLGRARKSNEPLEGIICNFFFCKNPQQLPQQAELGYFDFFL